MQPYWQINGEDLERWARRPEAADLLTEVVRRLLQATLPLEALFLRTDAAAARPRWDGFVRATAGSHFCPSGISFWDPAVEGDPRQLHERLRRFSGSADGARYPSASYVAVIARRFRGREDWAESRRQEGLWPDVRVLDADDLVAWLSRAPAVACWFAALLGRPPYDLMDLDSFLESWRRRTSPPLPTELVLAGHERQWARDQVLAWAVHTRADTLPLRADTREEAILFVAAALAGEPCAARCLVVHTIEAVRWVAWTDSAQPLILLPLFEEPLPQLPAERARVVLPLAGQGPPLTRGIELEPVPHRRFAEVLVAHGFPEEEADRRAQASGGKLLALQRLFGHGQAPLWAQHLDSRDLGVFLLVRSWRPDNPADGRVIEQLGSDPEELERLCAYLSRIADAAAIREDERGGRATWTWHSHEDAWRQLAPALPPPVLRRFGEAASTVLGRPDPRYELPVEERFAAAVHGKVPEESGALRSGICESLARLAQSDELLAQLHGPRAGSSLAERVVRRVLAPAWTHWASLAEQLPTLAEAAPHAFLDSIEESLRLGNEGVSRLLGEESSWGGSPHTGVLWALETLGWEPEFLPRVALALASLAARDGDADRPGRLANRPVRSLANLLHPEIGQTGADVEARLAVLRHVARVEPEVGFGVLLGYLDRFGWTIEAPQPRFRPWKQLGFEDLVERDQDRASSRKAYLDLLLGQAGTDAARWARLLDDLRGAELTSTSSILERLATIKGMLQDEEGRVWAALRRRLNWGPGQNEKDQNEERMVRSLYDAFIPTDTVLRSAWLFAARVELPEPRDRDWRSRRSRIDSQRVWALRTIWEQADRWEVLEQLTSAVDGKGELGHALGKAPFASEVENRLLHGPGAENLAPLLAGFASARHQELGISWSERTISSLLAAGRGQDALQVALVLPTEPSTWDLVEQVGEPVRSGYWAQLSSVRGEHSAANLHRAIEAMLEAGNVVGAASVAEQGARSISSVHAARVLKALRDDHGAIERFLRDPDASATLGALFEILDRDPDLAPEAIAELELPFLLALDDSERPLRFWQVVSQQPAQFLELLRLVYRAKGVTEPEPETDLAARSQLAKAAYRIMKKWKGMPEDDEGLYTWTRAVLDLAGAEGRHTPACIELGKVLARAPAAGDGHWPCLAARRLLEETPELGRHLAIAKLNLRGGVTKSLGEGGQQERELATRYRSSAAAMLAAWPRTAALLEDLARDYDRQADAEDAEAKAERRKLGIEQPGRPEPQKVLSPPIRTEPVVEEKGPLQLESILLRNVCAVGELDLKLKTRSDGLGQWTVLVGENGTGKSTVLRALAMALGGTRVTGALPSTGRYIRQGAGSASCAVTTGDGQLYRVTLEREGATHDWPNGNRRPFLCAYGPQRGSALGGPEPFDPEAAGVETLYSENARLLPAIPWLMARKLRALQDRGVHEELFEAIVAMLCDRSPAAPGLLPGVERIDVTGDRVWAEGVRIGGRVPLEGLSDGYLTVVGWVLDLVARWLARVDPRLAGQVGFRDFHLQMQGLVLVDEIDLHLHPRWQRTVIRTLRRLFPRLSFVSTTHNPLTLLGTEPGEIQVLRWSGEGRIEALPFVLLPGMRADQVLTDIAFGMETTVDDSTLELMSNHQLLLLEGRPPEDEQRRGLEAELRRRLGTYGDTAVDRMALEVAAELMRGQLGKMSPEERRNMREKLKERLQARLAAASLIPGGPAKGDA